MYFRTKPETPGARWRPPGEFRTKDSLDVHWNSSFLKSGDPVPNFPDFVVRFGSFLWVRAPAEPCTPIL